MVFHFDFQIWRQFIRLAWGEPDPRTRWAAMRKLLVVVPLVASFHAVCFALDALLFPSLRRARVDAPIDSETGWSPKNRRTGMHIPWIWLTRDLNSPC